MAFAATNLVVPAILFAAGAALILADVIRRDSSNARAAS